MRTDSKNDPAPMRGTRPHREPRPRPGPTPLPAGAGVKLLTTGIAWIIVYLLLMALFGIFEDRLAELELWLRLLIVSAVIVAVMASQPGDAHGPADRRNVDQWRRRKERCSGLITEGVRARTPHTYCIGGNHD